MLLKCITDKYFGSRQNMRKNKFQKQKILQTLKGSVYLGLLCLQRTAYYKEQQKKRTPTLAGVWDRSVLTELEEEQWDPVFVSVPDKRRFLDSGELDICEFTNNIEYTNISNKADQYTKTTTIKVSSCNISIYELTC